MDNTKKLTITINDKEYKVDPGQTIMQAADKCGYHIPRLCYHPKLSIEGACRVCIVEVEGMRNFVASCCYPVADGMKIHTNTKDLRQARRDIVELLLDNHPEDCHTCERDGNCELQRLVYSMGIRQRHFTGERKHYEKDLSGAERHSRSGQVHPVRPLRADVLGDPGRPLPDAGPSRVQHRGHAGVQHAVRRERLQRLRPVHQRLPDRRVRREELHAGAVREAQRQEHRQGRAVRAVGPGRHRRGLRPAGGRNMEGQLVAALRRLGFDYVFDTQFAADLTIMEEGSEFLERLQGNGPLPLITSCSSAWMKYVEQFYPDMLDNISTCKSPMSMASALFKTYWAEKMKIDPKKILSVAVMCCTAKKFEAARPELEVNGMRATDIVVTTREIGWMIKSAGIDFVNIKPEKPDAPLGLSSGAGVIFGVTGGVMEAAVRTAYELYTGETLIDIEMADIRGFKGVKEAKIAIDGKEIRLAVAHGLGNAHKVMEMVRKDRNRFHFIEIMGCPGGCIGGGGQPYATANSIPLDEEALQASGPGALRPGSVQDDPAQPRQPGHPETLPRVPGPAAQREIARAAPYALQGEAAQRHRLA